MTDHDYSPTIRDAAQRIYRSGAKVRKVGRLIGGLPIDEIKNQGPVKVVTEPHVSRPGVETIDGKSVAKWIAPYVKWARAHGWHGVVTSGYRSIAEQRTACTDVCGNPNGCPGRCAAPGTSNHQFSEYPRGAVDVTEYDTFERVMNRYPGGPPLINRLPLDPVHFSHDGH